MIGQRLSLCALKFWHKIDFWNKVLVPASFTFAVCWCSVKFYWLQIHIAGTHVLDNFFQMWPYSTKQRKSSGFFSKLWGDLRLLQLLFSIILNKGDWKGDGRLKGMWLALNEAFQDRAHETAIRKCCLQLAVATIVFVHHSIKNKGNVFMSIILNRLGY